MMDKQIENSSIACFGKPIRSMKKKVNNPSCYTPSIRKITCGRKT
jgi:hypothetical protein